MVIGDSDFYPLTHYLPLARQWTNPSRIIGNVRSFITCPCGRESEAAHLQVGARIRHARILKGMRMRDLALAVGYDESMISKIEAGKVTPSLVMLNKIVVALDRGLRPLFRAQVNPPDKGATQQFFPAAAVDATTGVGPSVGQPSSPLEG